MKKITRNILIALVIALLVFGIILIVYNHFSTKPINATVSTGNVLDDANTGLENIINDILDEENTDENSESNTSENSTSKNEVASSEEDEIDLQTTSNEKKAIELVKAEWKKEWGNLNDVTFNNVMVQGDGKYVVSVNDSSTTSVIRFYVVDITTEIVEEK